MQTNELQHKPDTETIVECIACSRRFLERNQGYRPGSEWDDDDRCPFCGTVIKGDGLDPDRFDVLVGDRHTISFAGGVRADVRLSGDDDLQDAVLRELTRAADDWHDRFELGDNRSLTGHHQKAVLDAYPRPLNFLASEVIALNAVKWLEDQSRRGTIGAETVREQGLTANQRTWLETIAEKLADRDAWACDECEENKTTATKGGVALCNECIFDDEEGDDADD